MTAYKRKSRSKRRKKFFLVGLFFFIVIAGLFWLFFFAPFLQVKEIEILGNQKVQAEELKKIIETHIFQFFFSRTIFWLNFQKAETEIFKNYPRIAEIDFQRKLPAKLTIKVKEREPIAIFYLKESPFFLDEQGVIFEEVSEDWLAFLIIRSDEAEPVLGQQVMAKEEIQLILKIQRILKENLKIEAQEFQLSQKRLNAKTSQGWEIYFDLAENIDWQLTKLSLALEKKIPPERRKELEYIDLRFGNMVYPKYR